MLTSNIAHTQSEGRFYPFIVSSISASAASIPTCIALGIKTAQQIDLTISRDLFRNMIRGGWKIAPFGGLIIGGQIVLKDRVKDLMKHDDQNEKAFYGTPLFSSCIVGGLSAPFLVLFHGKTRGFNWMESMRGLSIKQVGAMTLRESFFLGGLGSSQDISQSIQEKYQGYRGVKEVCLFGVGMVAALIGHPADTALTRWQNKMEIKPSQLMKGAPIRAITGGAFSLIYHLMKEYFDKKAA